MDNQNVRAFGHLQDEQIAFQFLVQDQFGKEVPYSARDIAQMITSSITGYETHVDVDKILKHVQQGLFDGITAHELEKLLVLSTVQFIELDNAYSYVASRLLLRHMYHQIVGTWPNSLNVQEYKTAFVKGIKLGVEMSRFDKKMLDYDLDFLSDHLNIAYDDLLQYLGMQTLYTRYLKKHEQKVFELPQAFWMRIAMGLALHEKDKNQKAVEFYNVIAQLHFVPSTPTLLHAGLTRAQLSSCYLTFVDDDLTHIFKCIGDNAQMSKWSGGVANDWSALRATGAFIKSINIPSQGTIPFLKVANDTTAAINRSGSRRGAVVAYMETWHYDFEEFLDLRRNTGDERRRTHDMNTAAWVPDLFMKRVSTDEEWTLFSPEEVPELHEMYGQDFEKKYVEYEQLARAGKIKLYKFISAKQLWRKMLTRLFETGHPWITFKDSCNIRSPQDHVGVIHSSNLCTEITLNTSREETAVCNLGSINLSKFIQDDKQINLSLLQSTVKTAIRMLDNVIDLNFYPVKEGEVSNLRHRPIGLGLMGLQDALYQLDVAFDSQEALHYSDMLTENVSFYAILASSQLAKERGAYSSFKGSKWDRGILPMDTLDMLEKERGTAIKRFGKVTQDWSVVRNSIKKYGMRNSNTMAIAPTATISNISGCLPCIEPIYKNLYVKSNSSGDFTVINPYLLDDLKKLGLWNEQMRDQIKYYDGSVQSIDEIPQSIKDKYKTAFELDPFTLIGMTASRGKWIDQSQSHNVFLQGTSGKLLHDIYTYAWQCGMKTTYYLRSLGASQIEKSTLDAKKYGFTQVRSYEQATGNDQNAQSLMKNEKLEEDNKEIKTQACAILDPDCESCQ